MLSKKEQLDTNLNDDEEKALMEVLKVGTSAGGARPKAVIAYNEKTGDAGRVAVENKPEIVYNISENKDYRYPDIAKKEGLVSLLCVPLHFKGKVVGALTTYTSRPHHFSEYEIHILQAVADQAAIVIENYRLVVETKVIKEELESRKVVERAKGILMNEHDLTEDEAFKRIQKFAMDNRKSMREIADAIVLSNEMKQENA